MTHETMALETAESVDLGPLDGFISEKHAEQLIAAIAAALEQVERETLERAAKAECQGCREGWPDVSADSFAPAGHMCPLTNGWEACDSSHIRALAACLPVKPGYRCEICGSTVAHYCGGAKP